MKRKLKVINFLLNARKYYILDEMFQLQQDSIKKKEVLNNNSVLKEQNIQLEKENIQNLELLKLQKQKVNINIKKFKETPFIS